MADDNSPSTFLQAKENKLGALGLVLAAVPVLLDTMGNLTLAPEERLAFIRGFFWVASAMIIARGLKVTETR